jgi:hypothetical protein
MIVRPPGSCSNSANWNSPAGALPSIRAPGPRPIPPTVQPVNARANSVTSAWL